MKIITLFENTTCREDVKCGHGLSLYIETARHKLLFDMGSGAAFAENAQTLGVELAAVDTAFLSHGHNDHSGGLDVFLRRNDTAKVYMQRSAWRDYYVVTPDKCGFIGIDPALKSKSDRFVLLDGDAELDGELRLISRVAGRRFWSGANDTLREKCGESYPCDRFAHEQSVLITEGEKTVLIGGCAHCGIVNILERAETVQGRSPDAVFAGFHLFNPSLGVSEPRETVAAIAAALAARGNTHYYTGHCTGEEAYAVLRETLGERLHPLPAGSTVTV